MSFEVLKAFFFGSRISSFSFQAPTKPEISLSYSLAVHVVLNLLTKSTFFGFFQHRLSKLLMIIQRETK